MKRIGHLGGFLVLALLLAACGEQADLTTLGRDAKSGNQRINVLLSVEPSDAVLAELGAYGKVREVLAGIDAVTMNAKAEGLEAIRALPFVEAANPDAERTGAPIDTVQAEDFESGFNTWDLDAVNVTDLGAFRTEAFTGEGVYVAVLDTGLLPTWRQYFPEERIAEEYARAFGGGGGEKGSVSEQPNKWEHDVDSHGTHVTSSVLGYSLGGTPINGVAPRATVIPVKVLNQNGSGWSSVVAAGIAYVGDLKAGPLADVPVVINMSLGGPELDAVEKAALDYAMEQGVVIVASAGNSGEEGMGYPGAYEPVISVAASGWIGEWSAGGWWNALDVADPTDPDDFYITDFSSREHAGQDLDVAAPGSWVVGPYQLNQSNRTSFYYLGGTSMASPHVAGIAALMLEKNGALAQSEVEAILEGSALAFAYGGGSELCRTVLAPSGVPGEVCWGPDASGAGLATADAALADTPAP